jgi:hypothetical protein
MVNRCSLQTVLFEWVYHPTAVTALVMNIPARMIKTSSFLVLNIAIGLISKWEFNLNFNFEIFYHFKMLCSTHKCDKLIFWILTWYVIYCNNHQTTHNLRFVCILFWQFRFKAMLNLGHKKSTTSVLELLYFKILESTYI